MIRITNLSMNILLLPKASGKKYLPPQDSKIDKLKKLNNKVKRPAVIFAYAFGILGYSA